MVLVLKSGMILNLANILLIGIDRILRSTAGAEVQLSEEDYQDLRAFLQAGIRNQQQQAAQANGMRIMVRSNGASSQISGRYCLTGFM